MRLAALLVVAGLGFAGPVLADGAPSCPLVPPVEEVEVDKLPKILLAAIARDIGDLALPNAPADAAGGRRLLWVRKQGTRWVVAYAEGPSGRDDVVSYEIGYDGSLAGMRKDVAFPATVCQLTERELWR